MKEHFYMVEFKYIGIHYEGCAMRVKYLGEKEDEAIKAFLKMKDFTGKDSNILYYQLYKNRERFSKDLSELDSFGMPVDLNKVQVMMYISRNEIQCYDQKLKRRMLRSQGTGRGRFRKL